jgi:hypothetical protein
MTGKRDELGNAVKFTTPTVANGEVFVGTQNSLEVLGLFDVAVGLPSAPTGLSATSGPPAPAPPSITLTWNNTAVNATGIKIERSSDGVNFLLASTVGRNASSFTDTSVQASFTYFYRVRATNQIGDSGPSNIATARTHIAAPALLVSDICANNVVLTWTSTADGHYDVARSLDGTTFTTIATVAAPNTTYTDSGLSFGTYFYRVTAVNADGDQTNSNVMSATVGPVIVSHGSGFAGAKDITVNGTAAFVGNKLEITTGAFGQAGSAFTNTQVGIRKFTTSFVYQAVPGTIPMADGLTFIIQGNSPMSLGASGGGMGFLNVGRSVAIKFDLFNHGNGGWSTGQYVDGHNPGSNPQPGEAAINLVGTPIDLTSGHPFKIDISYDGTKLIETITDMTTSGSLTIDDYPPVDIPAHVGGDAAFVGFGGGTGGLSAVQDVLSWTFTPNESGLPPRRPSNLAITGTQQVDPTHFNVTLGWKCNNAFTAMGYKLERSPDGSNFNQIAQLPVSQTTFTDMNLTAGQYFYRLRSFNASGNSGYTPVVCVPVGGPTVNHGSGFSCHDDLTANGNAAFVGSLVRLTSGGFGQVSSLFTNSKVDIRKFTTTFRFQISAGANTADGMAFVIQSGSPTALSTGGGGGLGYGSDTPGGPRGIRNSIAIKFDIFDNAGEGPNSTGLFSDGRSPTLPEAGSGDVLVNLNGTGIDLHSGHVFQVDLNYDGTMLTEKITDTSTSASFTTNYTVNLVQKVNGNTAFAGFTGATGGLTATQDVQTWTFQSLP